MTQWPPPQTPQKPSITSAVVSLAAGVVAVPAFVFGVTVVAWICALIGLFAGISGARRARGTAPGLPLAIVSLVVCSVMLLTLAGMLVLFLTRPWRY
ncbi:hypothetical protein [Agreia sp. VKM Ac-1783]|uniref:hypothetical protein n=1 Tax=Agreia sp. VKM Ac-1783 TaxID=1938889 RepID=UPI000A2AB719|nr:hypothetical protein [Agreia sp. VKM Ac-1783]SMQ73785.1 hypothetical protein SAMN06295943_3000 [Agreia sp. VKM Ac-1783]